MKAETRAASEQFGAGGNVHSAEGGPMRLLPVVLPRQDAWNERVARWAAA